MVLRVSVLLIAMAVSGCAGVATDESQAYAGLTSVAVTPHIIDGVVVAKTYDVKLGKEYAAFTLTLAWTATGDPIVTVDAKGVAAFQGQAIAATALVEIQKSLTELGMTLAPEVKDAIMRALLTGI